MRPTTRNTMMDKLGTLAALQQLDLGQTGSDQQQQQLDQQAQDQAVRQAVEMYGIEHQKALLPGQVTAQDISNQQGQYHLAFDPTMDQQKLRMGEADLAAQPGKNEYIGSQARQNDAQTAMSNAMIAAGEPAARVGLQNATADASRSGPMMQYAIANLPFQKEHTPVSPAFMQAQMDKLMPPTATTVNPEVDRLTQENAYYKKLLGTPEGEGTPHVGGTSSTHPLASLAIKGVLPDYPILNAGLQGGFMGNPLPWAQNLFGEDLYNAANQGDNLDMNSILLSKSAKARRVDEKNKIKQQAIQSTPQKQQFSAAF